MAVDADGHPATLDPVHAKPSRALTILPLMAIGACSSLGILCIFASVVFLGDPNALTRTLGVGIAISVLGFACLGVTGLVWYFTPAWLESAMAERIRQQRIGPREYAVAGAWSGFVLAAGTTLLGVVMLTAPVSSTVASVPQFYAIAWAVVVIALAPAARFQILGWHRRRRIDRNGP